MIKSKNKIIITILSSLVTICLILLVQTGCNKQYLDNEEAKPYDSEQAVEYKEKNNPKTDQQLEVEFIDVGQGDSALITCNNQHVLIDGGNANKSQVIYTVLNKKGITHLDYIIITHTDADHCGGVSGALNKATVGTCYCSEKSYTTKTWNNVIKYLNQQGKEITIPNVGDKISIGDAVITFLAPRKASGSDNNNSIVCRLDFGDTSFLFTGDAEKEEEQELISSGADLHADVLKVSHHGSSKCSTDMFLSKVKPKYSIISVGKNNYGHPGNDTISRLQKYSSQIYRTDQSGDITIISDKTELSIQRSKGV